jgi:DNA sulfur modification protein DndD
MFSLLINSNVYSRVEITDDFEVRLIDRSWNHQDSLNSGHIQILMTSMLWWLEQLSYFKLPIIIDTPLARLDPIHRKNMLEKYFSNAWWQVIILSQPSEITDWDKNNPLFSNHLKDWKFIQMNFNPDLLQTEVDYININSI